MSKEAYMEHLKSIDDFVEELKNKHVECYVNFRQLNNLAVHLVRAIVKNNEFDKMLGPSIIVGITALLYHCASAIKSGRMDHIMREEEKNESKD